MQNLKFRMTFSLNKILAVIFFREIFLKQVINFYQEVF